MFFPASLKEAILQTEPAEDLILPNDGRIQSTTKFKYLGSIITPLLNEDSEIEARIKKAKAIMGFSKHFFDNRDMDRQLKYPVYTSGAMNTLHWGCKTWNLTKKNSTSLEVFIMVQSGTSYTLDGTMSGKTILKNLIAGCNRQIPSIEVCSLVLRA
jgi:hypothetical protein